MDQVAHIEKKQVPVAILTVNGVRIDGMAYVPVDIRLLDEIASTLRPYLVIGQPKITCPNTQTTSTPEVAFLPKDQIHVAWPVEDQPASQV